MNQSAVKMYFWGVEFSDGFKLNQFDSSGKEILTRDIADKSCINKDNSIKENCNIFKGLEEEHGKVTKIGWYPFDDKFAKKCMSRQSTLRIATSDDLKPVEQIVPDNFYSTYLKSVNRVEYGINANKDGVEMFPLDSIQAQLHTTIVPRVKGLEPITNVIELRLK